MKANSRLLDEDRSTVQFCECKALSLAQTIPRPNYRRLCAKAWILLVSLWWVLILARSGRSAQVIEFAGAPDTIRTCDLCLRRANANQPCCPPPTEIEGLGHYLDEPRWIPWKDWRRNASFRRSSNGGFWPRKVENALSFNEDWLTPSPPLHCSPLYPIVRTDSETMSGATKAVAARSAMLPLVTAQTVASERGVGGRISRWRTLGGQGSTSRPDVAWDRALAGSAERCCRGCRLPPP